MKLTMLENIFTGPKYIVRFRRPLAAHLFIWFGAIAATLVVFTQAPDFYNEIISNVINNPQVFLYELIIPLLLIYLLYYAFGSVVPAVAAVSLFLFSVSIVYKYKVFLRGDPFMPTDIILRGEAFNIVSASSIKIGAGSLAILILIILGCAALARFFRFHRLNPATRIIGGIVSAAFIAASYFAIYINDAVYDSIPVKHNIYNMVNEFNSKGFILSFLHHTKDLNLGALKPDGYSAKRALEILEEYGGSGAGGGSMGGGGSGAGGGAAAFRPDVIFLMSEAFWDITNIGALVFDGTDGIGDPIPNFHELEKSCVTGELFTEVYGGGTDTTEFNVLTGHSVANFGTDVASAYKLLIRNKTDSIARAFTGNGYSAVALHPGLPWFYNRQNVYPWMGFEEFINVGSFDQALDKSGNYISDFAMTEKLIETYERYTGGTGKPFFCFAVSIQNHGPYDAGYMYGKIPTNYHAAPGVELSTKSDYAITNYVRGASDADFELGRLVSYLEGVGRPVVLVFFGDHLPGLGSNFAAYKELGYPIGYDGGFEEKANIFRERYIIWANGDAEKMWPQYREMKARTHRMSAGYLGVYLVQSLGLVCDPYDNLVEAMREMLPVYHTRFYSTDEADGAGLVEGAPDSGAAAGTFAKTLGDYRIAQYYKIFDEKR